MRWAVALLIFASCTSSLHLSTQMDRDVMYQFLDEPFEVCTRLGCLNQDLRMPLGDLGMRLAQPNDEPPLSFNSIAIPLLETNTRLIAGGHSDSLQLDFILYDLWPTSDDTRLYLIQKTAKRSFNCYQYDLPDSISDYHSMKLHLFEVYPEL
jgi:hypothetical protein